MVGSGKSLIPKSAQIGKVIQYYSSSNVEDGSEDIDVSRNLQKNLFKFWNSKVYLNLQESLPAAQQARLAALKAKGAATWMYPPPVGIRAMTDDTFRHAHRLRLGLPTISTKHDRICVCGEKIHNTTHLLSCSKTRGVRQSGDTMT